MQYTEQYMLLVLIVVVLAGKLMSSFGQGWRIEVYEVPPSMDMLTSPLQPFLFVVRRAAPAANNAQGQTAGNPESIQHQLQEYPTAVNADQLSDIVKVRLARSAGL